MTKAKSELNWSPTITFYDLVKILVDADMAAVGLEPPGQGGKILQMSRLDWTTEAIPINGTANGKKRGLPRLPCDLLEPVPATVMIKS